jgi:transcriptional regulator with XRE-family HTH domain
MAKKFSELLDKMPARARENSRTRTRSMAAALTLAELRKAFEVSQEDIANALDVKQANVSKIERREDMLLSTLAAYVQAMGGHLEIVAHFPGPADDKQRTIRLKPWDVLFDSLDRFELGTRIERLQPPVKQKRAKLKR